MLRFLLIYVLPFALTLYALVDCAQNDETRNLPKWAWILLVIFFPPIGSIAYLITGRSLQRRRPRRRELPPDDNPDFLKNI